MTFPQTFAVVVIWYLVLLGKEVKGNLLLMKMAF